MNFPIWKETNQTRPDSTLKHKSSRVEKCYKNLQELFLLGNIPEQDYNFSSKYTVVICSMTFSYESFEVERKEEDEKQNQYTFPLFNPSFDKKSIFQLLWLRVKREEKRERENGNVYNGIFIHL